MTDLAARVRRRLADVEGLDGSPGDTSGGSTGLDVAMRQAVPGPLDDATLRVLRRSLDADLSGAGPLDALLALPGVTDVLVNAPDAVWFDRGRGLERAGVGFGDDTAVRRLAQRLASAAGRRLDDATPFVDAWLPDGTRLHAVLPPLTEATTISLRVLRRRRYTLDDLVAGGAVPVAVAEVLRAVVQARISVLISGGTGTGKTTLLGALLGLVPPDQRLLLIEDASELVVAHPHVVRLCCRAANVEGAGAIGLRDLVRQSLRMRPDRIVVGEFRGVELLDLLVALNSGHDGGAATVHANSAADVPARLVALAALASQPAAVVTRLAAAGLQLVVHLCRRPDGRRMLAEIGVLRAHGDDLDVQCVWSDPDGVGPGAAVVAEMVARRAVPVPGLLAAPPQRAPGGAGCPR